MASVKVSKSNAGSKRQWAAEEPTASHAGEVANTDLVDLFVDASLSGDDDSSSVGEDTDENAVDADAVGDDGSSDDSSEYSGLNEEDSDSDESSDEDPDATETLYALQDPETVQNETEGEQPGTSGTSGTSKSSNKPAFDPSKYPPLSDPAEYEIDSSDEEDVRNTVGNIPMEWYKDYPHLGYNWEGKKIMKPLRGDEVDKFLQRMDDPNFWRTVKDKTTGQDVVLTDEDLEMIKMLQQGKTPLSGDPYEPFEDIFSHEVMQTSLSSRPPHKRSFIPSLLEKEKVSKLVHAIKMGWVTIKKPTEEVDEEDQEESYYSLWEKEEEDPLSKSQRARKLNHVQAPKMTLPGHAESYNPPPEYLLTEDEKEKWRSQDPEDRKLNFIPRQYNAMRLIPGWGRVIKERFERCMDLYLCPRQQKMKVNVDPEDLIPKLPKPKDLQPFPTVEAMVYRGHTGAVRSISIHPDGQFFASGSDDSTVRIWEISTGRCFKTYKIAEKVSSVAWCPKTDLCLLGVAAGNTVLFLNPEIGDKLVISNTDHLLGTLLFPKKTEIFATFHEVTEAEMLEGFRLRLEHAMGVTSITWHPKGDYFGTIASDGSRSHVIMHQLSKLRSQMPFKKLSVVQKAQFHPVKPFFFVCTQRGVRIYDLAKQQLKKTLQPSCQFISCMAIHPKGDNVLVGSFDSRLCWFDLDSSVKPYQTLRHHTKAVRQVTFHRRYPLFASCSDDGKVIVSHGMVYNDLNQFPLIVPVKILKSHVTDSSSGLGVLDVQFHPNQPWVFSSGGDKTIRLFV